ncbi:MAG: DUF4176 domain-containing protein [Bacilli bacterium]
MNELQTDYLLGQTLLEIEKIDFSTVKELNIENNEYEKTIIQFFETYAQDIIVLSILNQFIFDEEVSKKFGPIVLEKSNEYLTIKEGTTYFIITLTQATAVLKIVKLFMSDLLPLGSIVTLKKELFEDNKEQRVMIEQRNLVPAGKKEYIDYRAIPYPVGVYNESMYLYFSAEAISKIEYYGYTNQDNDSFELALKQSLNESKIYSVYYNQEFTNEHLLNNYEAYKKAN